jgi:hypothetical protein
MTEPITAVPNTAPTATAAVTSFTLTVTPWDQESEFKRFEELTRKLVNTPKKTPPDDKS